MSYEAIRTLVARTCMSMDREDFDAYLALCTDDYRYRVLAYSTEIRREMVWLDARKEHLKSMFEMIPMHVRMQGVLRRHVSVYTVDETVVGQMRATSSLIVTHTDLAGVTKVYAAGEFRDVIDVTQEHPRLSARDVWLDTRALGAGSHVPI